MCMAIGQTPPPDRNVLGRLWWTLAATPRRLLGLGSAIALLPITLMGLSPTPPAITTLAVALTTATLLAIAAVAMDAFPRWSARSPVHYLRYGGTFLFGLVGTGWLAIGHWGGGGTPLLACGLVACAWLLAITTLRDYAPWIPRKNSRAARQLMVALYLSGAALPASLLL